MVPSDDVCRRPVVTLYVIIDFEYPRLGLIRVDAADQILLDVRQSMQ